MLMTTHCAKFIDGNLVSKHENTFSIESDAQPLSNTITFCRYWPGGRRNERPNCQPLPSLTDDWLCGYCWPTLVGGVLSILRLRSLSPGAQLNSASFGSFVMIKQADCLCPIGESVLETLYKAI
ncbi:hypothetical protein PV05_02239 [Exophiala xenobiotica]|uniref:Uncharacterized protein n=1 Tax=Exophiala xenobiotica TaxID=348802 RepID=A0A0D2EPZ0_9EURO|nr:uncharacterized protein PV05_02239 [Exophiala xenobiotica]KIW57673.1 hypothetical protein PV05_02239 [Exophiala xenobiotica]